MSNIVSYDERVKNFDWSIAEKELDYKEGGNINIGWYCSDRICEMGKADKLALIWEGLGGVEKRYTFNDVRIRSNTIANYLWISVTSFNAGRDKDRQYRIHRPFLDFISSMLYLLGLPIITFFTICFFIPYYMKSWSQANDQP